VVESDFDEVRPANTRAELAETEAVFQIRRRREVMDGGATLIAPETVFLSWDTTLAPDVTVEPNVVFGTGVSVAERATIRAFSHLAGVVVEADAIVGPFARLRPGSRVGEGAHVGNFVELKAATLGAGAKANHLSYIGDATVGAKANIGAGTITANYDGVMKHHTEIGAGASIGSNAVLVAPVTIGEGAIVGAGTTVTEAVPDDAIAVARPTLTVSQRSAERHRARLKRIKADKEGKA
jgi:bifunctional UDP-N-acetylglucosamine pyrophosphorylase/glucosamine-1-phosphate N-acetyltransferase